MMIRLEGIKIGKKQVYLNHDDLSIRVGVQGQPVDIFDFVEYMPKAERRKFRKLLRDNGHADLVQHTLAVNLV